MSQLNVDTIKKADGTGNLSVPAETGTVVTTAAGSVEGAMTTQFGRRNLIINGAMQVAQRGTSSTSNGYATVDRFQFSTTNTDQFASTKTQDTTGPDGFSNSFKVVATTAESAVAADERLRFIHFIEAQDLQQLGFGTASAKATTLSFYVKSNVTGTYGFSMYQADNGRLIGGTYTINTADTWERKTLTFAGDTSGSITNDNGQGFGMEWYLLAGSNYTGTDNTSWVAGSADKRAYGHTANWGETTNDYWQVTGVQLEVGSVATPFEHRSYGEELAACQRYYYEFTDVNDSSEDIGLGSCYNTTQLELAIQFPVQMRSAPTYSRVTTGTNFYAYGNNTNDGFAGFEGLGAVSKNRTMIYTQAGDGFAGNTGQVRRIRKQDSAARINFDAEL